MCKHCDAILDVLRDAAVTVEVETIGNDAKGSVNGSVHVDCDHNDGGRGAQRAKQLCEAIANICGKRVMREVAGKKVEPRPSQKKKAKK